MIFTQVHNKEYCNILRKDMQLNTRSNDKIKKNKKPMSRLF